MAIVITLVRYNESFLERVEFRADQQSELYEPRGVEVKLIKRGPTTTSRKKAAVNRDHWINKR